MNPFLAERDRRDRLLEQKAAAEQDLLAFIRMFWRSVEPEDDLIEGWPLEALCDALMSVTDGHTKRLLMNIFPGGMKSFCVNVFFPAWEWGPCKRPDMRYISASYSSTLTERDNGRFLRIVKDPVYCQCWPWVRIIKEGVSKIENSATGWKIATSVGGTMTGQRGNRVLIDDANNPNDVESEVVRAQTNLWLREVMPDRLSSLGRDAVISIQQRTHEEDATGTLLKYGTGYKVLSIPMEFDPRRIFPMVLRRDPDGEPADVWVDPRSLDTDGNTLEGLYTDDRGYVEVRAGSPMAKAEGTLAWPERFSEADVEEQKKIKGPYGYSSQYQQLPTPRGGAIVQRDWWNRWTKTDFPNFGTVVASLDTATETHSSADYNALTVWGAFEGPHGEPLLMLLNAWRIRCGLAELVERVAETCRGFGNKPRVDYLLIEHKTRGRDVHDEIRNLYGSSAWETILVKPRHAESWTVHDKVNRLKAVSHLFSGDCRRDPISKMDVYSGGMIYEPGTDWADEVITEVASFPHGAHDDFVDSTSLALIWIRRHGVVVRKAEFDAAELEERRFKKDMGVPYAIGR